MRRMIVAAAAALCLLVEGAASAEAAPGAVAQSVVTRAAIGQPAPMTASTFGADTGSLVAQGAPQAMNQTVVEAGAQAPAKNRRWRSRSRTERAPQGSRPTPVWVMILTILAPIVLVLGLVVFLSRRARARNQTRGATSRTSHGGSRGRGGQAPVYRAGPQGSPDDQRPDQPR